MFLLEQFPLKYPRNALEPYMSENTVNFHYAKHFDAYIKNLNALILGTKYENMTLEDIVVESAKSDKDKKIFNNAGQVFNHKMFFDGMGKDTESDIPIAISRIFGGVDKFKEEFKAAALGLFGSGWVWLSNDKGKLKIETTVNADNPLAHGRIPLLALDVWEHAYYLDYQNRRGDFVDAFLDYLIDWHVIV